MAALVLVGFGAARAEDAVVVKRSNPVGTVLRDTVGGALVGSAVSGVIIGVQMGINDKKNYDWGRTLAWGAGIGAVAGLVWGVVDAASGPSSYSSQLHAHDGQSMTLDERKWDLSNRTEVPVVMGRF